MSVPFSLSILQLVFLFFVTYTPSLAENEIFCLQKSFQNGTCIINEDSSETCNGHGTFDKETLMCDCKAGWGGAYCEHCAYGVDETGVENGSGNRCYECDHSKGFYGDVNTGGCHVCPCSEEGWQHLGGRPDNKPEWHLAQSTDHTEPVCLSHTTPDIKGNPNKLAVCNCAKGWGGPLCTVCADGYYPSPELAAAKGVPACQIHCDRSLTCGDNNTVALGECNAMGECVCMPGAKSLNGKCVRCVEGETEMQGGINMCAPDYIAHGPPAIPSPPEDGTSAKGGDKCKNKPKWWIGLIIAGAAALLLAIIAGVIIIAMTSKSAAPGDQA